MPKDILGLGKHLVHELGLEDGNDTLGRWMAFHLAELINTAENDSSVATRSKARKEATEIIIKLWERRANLPGNAYPLAPYKHVLQVLDRLRPSENPFAYFNRYESKQDQLSVELFDNLTRLVISLLLMKVVPATRPAKANVAAIETLDEAELQVWKSITQWVELLEIEDKSSQAKRTKKADKSHAVQINYEEIAMSLIRSISTTLTELEGELKKKK
ncbi:MAG: hypothetical protein QY328_00465 [Anaerolineales bacterium]|nr:MAG: hypothetical protein QY328_00465 [Anaerolineales bacterium]